jgi:hypothetical protein
MFIVCLSADATAARSSPARLFSPGHIAIEPDAMEFIALKLIAFKHIAFKHMAFKRRADAGLRANSVPEL